MAEPAPDDRRSDTNPPATVSWGSGLPLDVPAVEGTAPYPFNPTASFAGTPDGANLETVSVVPGSLPTDPAIELPVIPGYRILGVLGGGGMGTVFKALHLALNKVVALKLINAGWANDNDFRARFAREAKALALLDHPNVVPIFDADTWQGLPYLTMKFVAGKTLYHKLEVVRRDPRVMAGLMVQVARAVHYLHSKGIVHRDLKPLNILLTDDGTPLVADFGLVRLLDDESSLSLTMVPLGTRQYMSPEQTLGGRENYTFACDIWALGIILYELLSGHRPFWHEDTVELYRQIRNDPVPAIPADRNAPQGLEAIARKCLQKSVAERYATAEEVAADLERWLAGEVIPLPPDLPPVVAGPTRRPPARRQYRWAIAAVMLALIGFSGLPPLPPRDEPRSPRTPFERIIAGDTVWIIGENGLPLLPPTTPLPGAVLSLDQNGYAQLNALTPQHVELLSTPLPLPILLEGEVAMRAGKPSIGHGGFYVGRQQAPLPGGALHSLFKVGVIAWEDKIEGDTVVSAERGLYELMLFREADRRHFTFTLDNHLEFTNRRPKNQAPPLRWYPIAVVIRDGALEPRFDGQELAAVDLDKKLRKHCQGSGFAPTSFPTPLGAGIGLFAVDAEVVFRNVRVSPYRP